MNKVIPWFDIERRFKVLSNIMDLVKGFCPFETYNHFSERIEVINIPMTL